VHNPVPFTPFSVQDLTAGERTNYRGRGDVGLLRNVVPHGDPAASEQSLALYRPGLRERQERFSPTDRGAVVAASRSRERRRSASQGDTLQPLQGWSRNSEKNVRRLAQGPVSETLKSKKACEKSLRSLGQKSRDGSRNWRRNLNFSVRGEKEREIQRVDRQENRARKRSLFAEVSYAREQNAFVEGRLQVHTSLSPVPRSQGSARGPARGKKVAGKEPGPASRCHLGLEINAKSAGTANTCCTCGREAGYTATYSCPFVRSIRH
jgi:hypothetical protein